MRAVLAVALLSAACARSDVKPHPEPTTAGPALSVAPPPADGVQAERPPEQAKRQPGEAVLLGTLHRMGTKTCTSRDHEDWSDLHLRAGLVRLEGNTKQLEALRAKPVIVFGSVTARGAPAIPSSSGPCPPYQSRSDWIDSPDGTILQRDDGPGINKFRVRAFQRFDQLRARRDGDGVVLELENPLDVGLDAATLRVHYEGCYGKPLTHREERVLGALAPGARGSATVPALPAVTKGNRPDLLHVPSSVQIEGQASEVYFDLDVPLESLGVAVECPER
jgi:hypothetical protein